MKCAACKYSDNPKDYPASSAYNKEELNLKPFTYFMPSFDNQIQIYVCPKCGTLKMDI